MRFHYISPSVLPSRAANSVHVTLQCEALARAGAEVTLYAKRGEPEADRLPARLAESYGIDPNGIRLETYFSAGARGDTLRIAAMAAARLPARPEAVLSRNLYAAFYLAVARRQPLLFETHQLETGFRKAMQRAIMTRPWVTTVAISERLVDFLRAHHGVAPYRALVLHDAAREGIELLPLDRRRPTLAALGALDMSGGQEWHAVCGYFGHLYTGRGIEIIEAMARARPESLFLVYGGNESDVNARRAGNALANLRYLGHVPHPVARRAMSAMDVLLMPYQASVSIGVAGHDTAGWMSPMKMFEYLASGVPVLSSDLPVLREVLREGENALLAKPDAVDAWLAAFDRLLAEPDLARALGETAHADYRAHHTWRARAERLMAAADALPGGT
jgi:hypothetical protein